MSHGCLTGLSSGDPTITEMGDSDHRAQAACTGNLPAGALFLEGGGDRVGVWRFPYDPDLPGLPSACDEGAVAGVLEDLGLGTGPVRLRTRAYRPRRRAVIEAVGSRGRLFVKVVRPDRAEALHDRHRLLVRHAVPVPRSLGWTPQGLVVLQALPGRTLRQALRSRTLIPPGSEILDLLDHLPPSWPREPRGGPGWTRRRTMRRSSAPRYPARRREPPAWPRSSWLPPTQGRRGRSTATSTRASSWWTGGASAACSMSTRPAPVTRSTTLRACSVTCPSWPRSTGTGHDHQPRRRRLPRRVRGRRTRCAAPLPGGRGRRLSGHGSHRVQEAGWPATTRRRLDLAESWLASAGQAR